MNHASIIRLRKNGLVEMGCLGAWVPTRMGRELLEDLHNLELLSADEGRDAAARDQPNPGGMMDRGKRAGRRVGQRSA